MLFIVLTYDKLIFYVLESNNTYIWPLDKQNYYIVVSGEQAVQKGQNDHWSVVVLAIQCQQNV